MTHHRRSALIALCSVLLIGSAIAVAAPSNAGRVKVVRGAVTVQRGTQRLPATVGLAVQEGDVVTTGADGSTGISFADDSMLSVGPNSTIVIEKFAFDSTTHQGRFETSLQKGTLGAISGKLAKQSPDAMKVRTPVAVMAVRGTHVLVRAGEEAQ